jgi:transposase
MSASNEGPIHFPTNNGSSANSPSGKLSYPKAGQGKNSDSPFLDLPAELRNEVYSFYFSETANFGRPRLSPALATQPESTEDHHPESESYSSNYSAYLARLETAEEESHSGKEESIRPSTQWSSTITDYNEHLIFNVDKFVPQPVRRPMTRSKTIRKRRWLPRNHPNHRSKKIVVN